MADTLTAAAERIADRLPELRRAAGLSQTALADGMVARGHGTWRQVVVSRIESGIRAVSFAEAESLSTVLGVPLVQMLGEQARPAAVERLRELNAEHRAAIGRARKAARHAYAHLLGVGSDDETALAQLATPSVDGAEQAWADWHALNEQASRLLRLLGEVDGRCD